MRCLTKRYGLTFLAVAAAGTLWHFVYGWLPCTLVSLFFPVNESVWEHLKLLFWPLLLAGLFLSVGRREKQSLWGAVFTAVLFAPCMLLGVYYTLNAGFAVHAVWADILLYYLTLTASFLLICHLDGSRFSERWAKYLIMPVGFYGASLMLFTLAPPALPIFR